MVAVGVVEGSLDRVVHVVAMRDGGMTAASAVAPAALDRGASPRPAPVHVEVVLVGVAGMRGVEVPVVEIVGMITMPDHPVAAGLAVLVGVPFVLAAGHAFLPLDRLP